MYIIKLNQSIQLSDQSTIKRPSSFSQLNNQKDSNQAYSDSFRQLMNKVLNKIYNKNNFIKTRKKHQTFYKNSPIKDENIKNEEGFKITKKKFSQNLVQHNKLNIRGVGRNQNGSNLLKNPKIYNKTSVSFIRNKQHRKSIEHQRTRSLNSELNKQGQFQSKASVLDTFYNSRYSKRQLGTNDSEFNIEKFMPKIIVKQNYQKIHDLFKRVSEPKPKKIQLSKRIYNKKLIQRQKNIQKEVTKHYQDRFSYKQVIKNQFQPWNINQNQANQQVFSNIKRNF